MLFAARDYPKISRAATDATGASLTVLKFPILVVGARVFGNNYSFRWWGPTVNFHLAGSQIQFRRPPNHNATSGSLPEHPEKKLFNNLQKRKAILIPIPHSPPNNDLTVGDWTKRAACPSQAMLCKAR
jgi:hypothetical protein